MDGSRDTHFLLVHKYCEMYETLDGILFKKSKKFTRRINQVQHTGSVVLLCKKCQKKIRKKSFITVL